MLDFMRVPRPAASTTGRALCGVWLMASDGSTERRHRARWRGAGNRSRSTGAACDRLDLDQGAARQGGHLDGAAGRRGLDDVPGVDGVDRREVGQVGQEDRGLDDVGQRHAGGREDRLQVDQRPLRLVVDAVEQLAGGRVQPELAGAEDEAVDGDGLAVRADGGRRPGRGDLPGEASWLPTFRDGAATIVSAGERDVARRTRRIVVAATNGLAVADRPASGAVGRLPTADEARGPASRRERGVEDPGVGPEPDWPTGRPSRRPRAARKAASAGATSRAAGRRSLAAASSSALARSAAAGRPARSSAARRSEAARAAGRCGPGAAGVRGEDGRRRDGQARRDEQHGRGLSLERRQRLDELATAGDEGRAPGQEERHVRAERRSQVADRPGGERGAPGLERRGHRRRRVAAAAAQARRDGDALGQPRRQGRRVVRGAGPRGAGHAPTAARPRSPAGPGCRA